MFIGFYVVAAFMAWRIWQQGDREARIVMLGILGGLLAHAVYGLVDAVTFWDRFAFFFWLMLGLLAAQYRLVTGAATPS